MSLRSLRRHFQAVTSFAPGYVPDVRWQRLNRDEPNLHLQRHKAREASGSAECLLHSVSNSFVDRGAHFCGSIRVRKRNKSFLFSLEALGLDESEQMDVLSEVREWRGKGVILNPPSQRRQVV